MAITNATLAQAINDLVAYWDSFNEEYATWISGEVGGGPNLDGEYPLTDFMDNVRLTKCPAQLEYDVTGVVNSASSYATSASNSQTAAETAETNAQTAETNAAASEAASAASEAAALAAQTAAESARTTCIAQAAAASASAATASSSAGDASTDAAAAAASASAAAASAAAAAASAADAATFDPALFAALADAETVTGAWQFKPDLGILHIADGNATGTSATPQIRFYDSADTLQSWLGLHSASDDHLYMYNNVNSGLIRLYARNSGGTAQEMIRCDPNNYNLILHPGSGSVLTTQTPNAAGHSTGSLVKHHDLSSYDVGMNVAPRKQTNASFTWTADEAGCLAYYSSGSYTITLPNSSDIPDGAQLQVWSRTGGTITIAPGAGAILYWLDGTNNNSGTRSLKKGMCTIWKFSSTTYFMVGNGIT